MNRKVFVVLVVLSIGALFVILFGLHQKEIEKQEAEIKRKASMPEWAAIWERSADLDYLNHPSSKNSPSIFLAIEKEYPIGSPSEKIFSDCKALGYDLVKKETNIRFKATTRPPFKFDEEHPCQFNVCQKYLPYYTKMTVDPTMGAVISIAWCEENGKVTWIKVDGGVQMD